MTAYWIILIASIAIAAWAFCRIGRTADAETDEAMRKHLHDIGVNR